ncbi:MAG: ABC transporter permease [Bryobacterales bacterium]|nr:ABC transporter permease [Bryobacterales bacterium]
MLREWVTALRLRLRALVRRRRLEQDLEDEIAFHLAMKTEKLGAADLARRQFGNATRFRETCRELWSLGRLEILWQDVRYSARLLRRSPVFTVVAVLSLALGIGANTTIFSLLNGVMLRSLPVPNPHELRVVNWVASNYSVSNFSGSTDRTSTGQTASGTFTYPAYLAFRDRGTGFSDVFAFSHLPRVLTLARGQALNADGLMVSGNFFRGLGARALAGRSITPDDDRPVAAPVAVISYGWWERSFGLDPGVLGQAVTLNGFSYTIVGVMARGFSGPLGGFPVDFYVPMAAQPQLRPDFPLGSPEHWWVDIMARLRPGADERQAQAAIEVLFHRALGEKAAKASIERGGILLEDGSCGPLMVRRYRAKPLFLLMGAVGLVLLIACTNLASLLLARGAARQREMALRVAIGAGRLQLVRQMLTESLLISAAGGCLGLVLAYWGKAAVVSLLGTDWRFDVGMDVSVLLFTFGVSLLTALLFGLAPAIRATRVDCAPGLKGNSAQGAPRLRLGKVLVGAQVGLSLLLLVGAGLFARTLVNLWRVDPGFNAESLLLFHLDASRGGYEGRRLTDYYERVRESIAAIPGVRAATVSNVRLLSGSMSSGGFTIPGRATQAGKRPQAHQMRVGHSFLATMGIPLLLGRDLSAADHEASPKVVVVNETFARSFFPGESPVGKTITQGKNDLEIVGVCRDAKYQNLIKAAPPTIYFPYRQGRVGAMHYEIRTAVPSLAVVAEVRRAVAAVDRNIPLTEVRTQTEQIEQTIAPQRLFASLCGFLALLALLLSSIGLYGVMAYTVARRTSEIGIRMALGAGGGDVLWMVMREALLLAAAGTALGVPAALAATRLVQSNLFGIKPNDPATIAGAAAVLLAVAAFAAWIPARRAARVDPLTALRHE